MSLPRSAADSKPGSMRQTSPCAYILNPLKDKELLTPEEAMDGISKLSATLCADNRYRADLRGRGVPEIIRNDHVAK